MNETNDALDDRVKFWVSMGGANSESMYNTKRNVFGWVSVRIWNRSDEEFKMGIGPSLYNTFDEEKGQNLENHRKETLRPSMAKTSTDNLCKFVNLSESDVQTFIQEQSYNGTLNKRTKMALDSWPDFLRQP